MTPSTTTPMVVAIAAIAELESCFQKISAWRTAR